MRSMGLQLPWKIHLSAVIDDDDKSGVTDSNVDGFGYVDGNSGRRGCDSGV